MITVADLRLNLEQVLDRLERAAGAANRSPADVRLVAVSKTFPAEAVLKAIQVGLADFGENRVQEAALKIPAVTQAMAGGAASPGGAAGLGGVAPPGGAATPASRPPPAAPTWHLIGHLQSNKAARAVELFDLIHSIDSESLARETARRAAQHGRRQPILLQVNCSGEAAKSGCEPDALPGLAEAAAAEPALELLGLMTIGPLDPDPEAARPAFRMLARLRDEARRRTGLALPHLSMGMSGDLEVAVAEGATLVRVGSALFGAR
jgi:uncharacterized pyridoxal phosphate-containing UPF0001 family protein